MYLDYNVTGDERKRLVRAIAAYTQTDAKYLGAPTFAYEVDYFTIDRHGCVSFDDRADSEGLIGVLVGQGFVAQVSDLGTEDEESAQEAATEAEEPDSATTEPASPATQPDSTTTEAISTTTQPDNLATEPTASEAPVGADEAGLTISLPLDGFNPDSLDRLQKLVDSKASLIRKALGANRLTVQVVDCTVRFPWWDTMPEPEEVAAYSAFLAALCRMAKEAKRVIATEKDVESEKYAFRGLLLRMGFIGAESKEQRKLLLKNLSGASAFPTKAAADAFAAAQKEKRIAAKATID